MTFHFKNPRTAWLILIATLNIISAYLIFEENSLLGESAEIPLRNSLSVLPALLMVLLSYFGVQAIILPLYFRLKIIPYRFKSLEIDKKCGLVLLVLQVCFITFFTVTGTFIAGSREQSDSPLTALWVLVNVDTLFFIYYGFYRESKLFQINLLISVISNVLRGWTGVFMLIIFMESARLIRAKKLKLRHILLSILVVVLFFPIVQIAKFHVRDSSATSSQDITVYQIVENVTSSTNASDYIELAKSTGQQIITRLHLVSSTILISQELDTLVANFEAGQIQNFWKEGIYGIIYDRLTGEPSTPNLGFALASLISGGEEVYWNSNPGFFAWVLINPIATPIYLIYSFGMLFIWVFCLKKIKDTPLGRDMVWYAALMYLIPGWIASCVLFTHTFILFLLFHYTIGYFSGRRDNQPG